MKTEERGLPYPLYLIISKQLNVSKREVTEAETKVS